MEVSGLNLEIIGDPDRKSERLSFLASEEWPTRCEPFFVLNLLDTQCNPLYYRDNCHFSSERRSNNKWFFMEV